MLTIAAYSSVGPLGFVTLDDPNYITDNAQVTQGLTWSGVEWAFTTGHASNWHPLTWLSHLLDVELFGVNPGPHHLVNLLFHILNRNMFWPSGLAALYPLPKTIPLWQPLGSAILMIMITFGAIKLLRRYPYVAVGWFWYIGTLVPVIGIIQVGGQSMADRYTYIPLIGLFIIIAWGGYDLLVRGTTKRTPVAITIALLIASLGVATWVQLQHWTDAKSLSERALSVTSDNARAHVAYGSLLADEERHKEAAAQFASAIRIQPNYA